MSAGSVKLSDVRVCRSGRTILEIESLDLLPGTFLGLVGTNGAGKTTLLNVCAGLIRPDTGRVTLDGNDLTRLSPWRRCAIRKRIGYIPQTAQYNMELPFTVREIVTMGRTSVRPLMIRLNREDYEIADRWIDTLGLADRRDQTFRSLSGGEQQKVLIARAMTQGPRILMLDEPCASLDFTWKYRISEMVERLYGQTKVTVLMISHDTSVLPASCRRVILLSGGRILADGEPESVLSAETLRHAYGSELAAVTVGGRRHIVDTTALE